MAIVKLHANEIWARRGYPGSLMPHITDTAVVVNIHKYSPEGIVLVAEICAPMTKGMHACEDMAKRIDALWSEDGGVVTYGGHKFDGKSGLYQMSLYGQWLNATEETTGE